MTERLFSSLFGHRRDGTTNSLPNKLNLLVESLLMRNEKIQLFSIHIDCRLSTLNGSLRTSHSDWRRSFTRCNVFETRVESRFDANLVSVSELNQCLSMTTKRSIETTNSGEYSPKKLKHGQVSTSFSREQRPTSH
jgi:hypothetical protein